MKTDSSALGPDPYGFVGGVIGWRLGPATSSSDGSTLITVNSDSSSPSNMAWAIEVP